LCQRPHLFWTFDLYRRFEVIFSQTFRGACQLLERFERRLPREPHARAQQNQRADEEARLNGAQAIDFGSRGCFVQANDFIGLRHERG